MESLGGCVMWVESSWRVDGYLLVSRAIGKKLFVAKNVKVYGS